MKTMILLCVLFVAGAIASHSCLADVICVTAKLSSGRDIGDDKEKEDEGGREGRRRGRGVNKEGLKDLPADVKQAAEGAVKGIVLTGATKSTVDGKTVYNVSGTAAGKTFVMQLSAEGKVLKVADGGGGKEDEEEDDDDDHKERKRRRDGKSKRKDDD